MPVILAACPESAGLHARNCMGLAVRSPACKHDDQPRVLSICRQVCSQPISLPELMTGMGPSTSFTASPVLLICPYPQDILIPAKALQNLRHLGCPEARKKGTGLHLTDGQTLLRLPLALVRAALAVQTRPTVAQWRMAASVIAGTTRA